MRLLSFSMVLGIDFLLLVSLVLSASPRWGDYLGSFLPGGAALGQALNATVSLVVVTVLFAMIHKLLPDTYVAWRDVWLGALNLAALHSRKVAIGYYLGKASVGRLRGGSVVILLLWVYYSSMLLYFVPSSPTSIRCATGAGACRRPVRTVARAGSPPGGAAAKP